MKLLCIIFYAMSLAFADSSDDFYYTRYWPRQVMERLIPPPKKFCCPTNENFMDTYRKGCEIDRCFARINETCTDYLNDISLEYLPPGQPLDRRCHNGAKCENGKCRLDRIMDDDYMKFVRRIQYNM